MNNWKEIRNYLIENFKNDFDLYLVGKSISFEDVIDLFNEVCSLREVHNALSNLAVTDSSLILSRQILASKIEGYFKLIYILIDDVGVNGEFGKCINRFFGDIGFVDTIEINKFFAKDSVTKSPSFSSDYFSLLFPFGNSLKYVYDLRNLVVHKHSIPAKTASLDVYELILIYIYVTSVYFDLLKINVVKKRLPVYNFSNYLNGVIDQFKTRIGRFVAIDGLEDSSLILNLAVEKLDFENRTKVERRGTLDSLRSGHVPEKRMLVWGEAGTGKSTSLEYLAYIDAQKALFDSTSSLPVYLPLSLLSNKDISIKSSIFNKISVDERFGEIMLKEGKINIFIDGLNEIPKDEDYKLRTLRYKEIESLLNEYSNVFIIISNRPQEKNIFKGVPVFRLLKMSDNQIDLFLDKNVDDQAARDKIKTVILDDEKLRNIVRVPLMLARFVDVVVYDNKPNIPTSKGGIIKNFIENLYNREREEKKDAAFDTFVIHRMLSKLGYESFAKNETNSGMKENEMVNVFMSVKRELGSDISISYVMKIITELGIVEKIDGLFLFAHQEYQDYFNAEQYLMSAGL